MSKFPSSRHWLNIHNTIGICYKIDKFNFAVVLHKCTADKPLFTSFISLNNCQDHMKYTSHDISC